MVDPPWQCCRVFHYNLGSRVALVTGLRLPVWCHAYNRWIGRQDVGRGRKLWHIDTSVEVDLSLTAVILRPTIAMTKLVTKRERNTSYLALRQHKDVTFIQPFARRLCPCCSTCGLAASFADVLDLLFVCKGSDPERTCIRLVEFDRRQKIVIARDRYYSRFTDNHTLTSVRCRCTKHRQRSDTGKKQLFHRCGGRLV